MKPRSTDWIDDMTAPRLRGRYAAHLASAQKAAWITVLTAAAATFGVYVIWFPRQLLWPAASLGTPQHWFGGSIVALLLLTSLVLAFETIFRNADLRYDLSDLSAFDRYLHDRGQRSLARQSMAIHLLLAAALTTPLLPALAAAWQHNQIADVHALGPQLLWRLAPATLMHLLHLGFTDGLSGLVTSLQNRQYRADVAVYKDQPAPVTATSQR